MEQFLSELEVIDKNCDIRQAWKVQHSLTEVLFLVITGFLFDCADIVDICLFGEFHLGLLRNYLPYDNGCPSKATIYRCLSMVNPVYMRKLLDYKNNSMLKEALIEAGIKPQIAVDGKYAKANKSKGRYGLNILSALNVDTGVVEKQSVVGAKRSEISKTPKLLDMMDLKGCIVTADALNTHHTTIKSILKKGADYVLPIKENNKVSFKALKDYFEGCLDKCDYSQTISKGHGRMEARKCYTTTDIEWLEEYTKWEGLKSIGYIKKTVIEKGKTTVSERYYITSLDSNPEELMSYARNHWRVEVMHWYLDMCFNEDRCNSIDVQVTENLNIIRKFTLQLITDFQKTLPDKYQKASKKSILKLLTYNMEENLERLLSLVG